MVCYFIPYFAQILDQLHRTAYMYYVLLYCILSFIRKRTQQSEPERPFQRAPASRPRPLAGSATQRRPAQGCSGQWPFIYLLNYFLLFFKLNRRQLIIPRNYMKGFFLKYFCFIFMYIVFRFKTFGKPDYNVARIHV